MANILLSCRNRASAVPYAAALEKCGCRVLTADESCIGWADALVLGGGADLSPKYYRYRGPVERIHIESEERDALEFELVREYMARARPILGICRGAQLLAAALGGTLIEDIPAWRSAEGSHVRVRHMGHIHTVETAPGSMINSVLGRQSAVNSFHHQAVRHPGPFLKATARAPDGVIEAVEHISAQIFGVQWHPERMPGRAGIGIFEYFCRAARGKV